ncbi:hypothetical protein E3J79_01835 [Candidatus Dependentiae bacterium]|nr:MAG: hypothetical protein E3J79_01835 [Candidatus Dependentiae bacterium]
MAIKLKGSCISTSSFSPFNVKFEKKKSTSYGSTIICILTESHASIHTYPEYNSCFVDLFTCGKHCSHEPFDTVLQKYLKPAIVQKRVLIRN